MEYIYWIVATLAGIVVSAGIIHLAAVIVGPSDRGFGAAFIAAVLLYIIGHLAIIPLIFFTFLFVPWWVLVLVAVVLTIYIIWKVYETSFAAAFIMWVIAAVFNAVYLLFLYGPVIVRVINIVRVAGGREPL